MCGIAGILRIWREPPSADLHEHRAIPASWLDALDSALARRGPDGRGRYATSLPAFGREPRVDVALVHRRLAVIDKDGGAQPMLAHPAPTPLAPPNTGPHAHNASPQPLAVVFNGCIYNHRDLRARLVGTPPSTSTNAQPRHTLAHFTSDHSDTEVIPWGWRAWGPHLRAQIDGMYAFALWDPLTRGLVLARDPFGERPLHVLEWDLPATSAGDSRDGQALPPSRVLAFASLPGALMPLYRRFRDISPSGAIEPTTAHPHAADGLPLSTIARRTGQRDLDVASWLMRGFGDTAPLPGFRTLLPGQWLIARAPVADGESILVDAIAKVGAAEWPATLHGTPRTRPVTAADVVAALDAGVRSCLEADVPIGCFLSGGVDSSIVAALAARHVSGLGCFTVRMGDARYDESARAARVAKALGVSHRILDCEQTPATDLPALIAELGMPLADSSLLPTHWVSRAARAHVAVCLSGDGGDELFAGYERHRAAYVLAGLGPARRALDAAGEVLGATQRSMSQARGGLSAAAAKARRFTEMSRHGYARVWCAFEPSHLRALGVPSAACARLVHHSGSHTGEAVGGAAGGGSAELGWDLGDEAYAAAGRALDLDRDGPLAMDMLTKVDCASLACALEVRAPMLTRHVAAVVARADPRALMPGGKRKWLLKQVARQVLPGAVAAEVTSGPKQGFAVPIGEWYRTDFGGMRRLLLESLTARDAWPTSVLGFEMDRRGVRALVEAHTRGAADHTHRLHALLVLALWAKGVASGPTPTD
jgi:asparagine synthase (glutamine-hydrolysing)